MHFRKIATWLTLSATAATPLAIAQNPTILQGNYISNVFGNSNFVLNPNAQTNVANVTNATRSTTTPLVATSEFNLSLASGANATWTLRAFDAGMKGQNCEARFSYRGFATATTKAELVQNSLVVASLTLTPTTDPRIASINFPCGDLAHLTTFRIAQTTANMTGTNEIGGIYVGLATNMANVAQAQAIFRANDTNGALIPTNTTTNVVFPALIFDADGGYDASTGIYTIRKAGRYQIHARVAFGLGNLFPASIDNYIILNRNGSAFATGFWSTPSYAAYPNPQITTIADFAVGDQINVTVHQNTGSGRNLLGSNAVWSDFMLSRFPSSSELVVKPETQNVFGGMLGYSNSGTNAVVSSSWTKLTTSATLTRQLFGKADTTPSNDLSLTIKNLPVGTYEIKVSGAMQVQANSAGDATFCTFGISDLSSPTNPLGATQVSSYGDASTTQPTFSGGAIVAIYRNESVVDKTFTLFAKRLAGSGNCNVITVQSDRPISITVTPLDQPSNSALYVEGPVKAAATGAAIPAGYVGEVKRATSGGFIAAGASAAWKTNTSLTLEAGVWMCQTAATSFCGAANCSDAFTGLSGTNNGGSITVDGETIGINAFQTGWTYISSGSIAITLRSTGSALIFPDGTTTGSNILYSVTRVTYPSGFPLNLGKIYCTRLN